MIADFLQPGLEKVSCLIDRDWAEWCDAILEGHQTEAVLRRPASEEHQSLEKCTETPHTIDGGCDDYPGRLDRGEALNP